MFFPTGFKLIPAGHNEFLPQKPPPKLNIAPDPNVNAIMRLEVELRDKNQPAKKKNKPKAIPITGNVNLENIQKAEKVDVPMEQVKKEAQNT